MQIRILNSRDTQLVHVIGHWCYVLIDDSVDSLQGRR
jgi:hypothetical protein